MKAADLAGLMPGCCSDVLDSMCFIGVLDTSTIEPERIEGPLAPGDYGFSLRFMGDVSGRFGMQLDLSTARQLTSNFLAKEVRYLETSDVDEVIGELTNMLCGSVVSRVDGDHGFVLSRPEPIHSLPDFAREDVLVSRLETDSGVITTWFVVEGDTCPQ